MKAYRKGENEGVHKQAKWPFTKARTYTYPYLLA